MNPPRAIHQTCQSMMTRLRIFFSSPCPRAILVCTWRSWVVLWNTSFVLFLNVSKVLSSKICGAKESRPKSRDSDLPGGPLSEPLRYGRHQYRKIGTIAMESSQSTSCQRGWSLVLLSIHLSFQRRNDVFEGPLSENVSMTLSKPTPLAPASEDNSFRILTNPF